MPLFSEIFGVIESGKYSAATNLSSGLRGFIRLVKRQDAYRQLEEKLREGTNYEGMLLGRVVQLGAIENDARYEHPKDAAVATYVLALSELDERIGRLAAAAAAEIPRAWWARHLAVELLHKKPVSNSAYITWLWEGLLPAPGTLSATTLANASWIRSLDKVSLLAGDIGTKQTRWPLLTLELSELDWGMLPLSSHRVTAASGRSANAHEMVEWI